MHYSCSALSLPPPKRTAESDTKHDRFPEEDWVEYRTACHLRTDIIVPVGWLIIQCDHRRMPLVCPRTIHLVGASGATVVACVIMLFLPELSPLWGEPTNTSDDTDFSEETTSAHPRPNVADTAEYGVTGTHNHSN